MTTRIEWRTQGKGKDALLYVGEFGEDDNTVLRKVEANTERLGDFLNDMDELESKVEELETKVDEREPQQWGDLVMSRSQEDGEVLNINPELYWDAVYYWFRRIGKDPHPWARRSS